ncbi:vang-like protein 1 isoform X1 [Bufo bufo]|uniref:vang-like protein 1 isoform X1 n=1 Tax=Bufo bufo TaxID=8384 RepID=UPI001ABE970E|nr:vang-like protein 1 isoform X1 [Bufo bufo]
MDVRGGLPICPQPALPSAIHVIYSTLHPLIRRQFRKERNHDGHKSVTIEEPTSECLSPAEDSGRGEEEDEGQDDNWGETTTALTSERSASLEELVCKEQSQESQGNRPDTRTMVGFYMFCVLCALTILTPPLFIVLPQVLWGAELEPCGVICEGLYISVAFKLLFIILGSWAVFFRRPCCALPRLVEFRALLLLLLSLFLLSYWLFYVVRILGQQERNLLSVVQYTVSLVDAFIFIHYLAVVLLEIRQLQPFYILRVVRSSDGEARCYTVGRVSLQRSALFVLENFYKDFPAFTPRPQTGKIRKQEQSFEGQCLLVDGLENNNVNQSQALIPASTSYKERYYADIDQERKIRRRRARLVVAVHKSFSQVQRLDNMKSGPAIDPREAAQSIFPLIAQSLQRYLRSTNQTHLYSMEAIIEHLTLCLTHNMSPQAFLEQYLRPGPPCQYSGAHPAVWTLVSEESVTRSLKSDLTFCLRSADAQLVVSVSAIPRVTLTENFIPPNSHRFLVQLYPEALDISNISPA